MAHATIEPGMMRLLSSEMAFVSRPDLRPPRWNVTTYQREALSPGYWFIGPYADLGASSGSASLCQIGPHIYDEEGRLVWSGACDVHNRNTFDFKTWGTAGLLTDPLCVLRGAGLVLDDTYAVVDAVDPGNDIREFNFHEYTQLPNGIGTLVMYDNSSTSTDVKAGNLLVWDGGFLQLDPEGKATFQWRALDHIDIEESTEIRPEGGSETEWDWFHANSVDRGSNGDYLVSARHTDCIYKISGHDGSILWRLGGLNSTLTLIGFTFSRQHDARFVPSGDPHDGSELISFLNNAADSHHNTSATSAAYLVEVDTNEGTARLAKKWPRPDGKLGVYRGNVQFLDNGNAFVHWGDNGYITEFDSQGNVLQEAHLLTSHLGTYRAYKFDFKAKPSEPIAMQCTASEASVGLNATVCHISWNGATEVREWQLHDPAAQTTEPLARGRRTDFETVLVASGRRTSLYALAIGADAVLGESEPYHPEPLLHGNVLKEVAEADVSSYCLMSHQSGLVRRWQLSGLSTFMGGVLLSLLLTSAVSRCTNRSLGFAKRT